MLTATLILAQSKLEDVLKSTGDSLDQSQGSGRTLALIFAILGVAVLLVILQQRRKQAAVPTAVNHQGRLLKEVLHDLPLKPAAIKQLKQMAEQQSCSSPLVMLLCPSLLAKAMQNRTPEEKQALVNLYKNIKS
jgi:hypothetical protein